MAIQYSIQKMVSDGTLSTITLGIQYLQRNDIYIRIAGEETPQSGAPSGYTWSFLDNTTLKILPVVPNGVEVVVYRRTDVDAMYNIYSQNAQFDEATIDENNQQLLYIAQEYLEQGLPGAGVDTIEYVRDDGSFTYYRMRRTDGSYSEEFTVPSASNSTKVLTRESLRRSYAEAGLNLVGGSFESGGVLVNTNDVLLYETTGKAFSGPAGNVPAGTNPSTGGFVDRSEYILSSDISIAKTKLSAFISSSLISVGDLFSRIARLDLDFSTVTHGDATSDYGPAINTILAAAAFAGIAIDGGGKTFYVRTPVVFPSKLIIRRVTFESLGAPAGDSSAKSHVSVVHVAGVASPVSGIYAEDVIANGRRDLWPNINMSAVGPEGGGGEDGGMHAFRLAGRVTDSVFVRCRGMNAGTAGWAIHNPLPATSTDYQKRNLTFIDCDGVGNREHGMFADSFDGIAWIRGKLTGNGTDLNTTDPLQHGNRGARSGGKLFGGPFDLECYTGFIGSSFRNFVMEGTDCRGNAVGVLIYCPIPSSTDGLQPTENISIDGNFDSGSAAAADRLDPNTFGYAIYTVADGSLAIPTIVNLKLSGKAVGSVRAHSTKYINTDDLVINTTLTNKIDYAICSGMRGGGLSNVVRVGVQSGPVISFTQVSGAATTSISATLIRIEPGIAGLKYIYSLNITGAVAAGGVLGITVQPSDLHLISDVIASAARSDNGMPVPCYVNPVSLAQPIVSISTTADTNLTATFSVFVVNQ